LDEPEKSECNGGAGSNSEAKGEGAATKGQE
jgi:hypothetical protein